MAVAKQPPYQYFQKDKEKHKKAPGTELFIHLIVYLDFLDFLLVYQHFLSCILLGTES
jgi:hypothetical protein